MEDNENESYEDYSKELKSDLLELDDTLDKLYHKGWQVIAFVHHHKGTATAMHRLCDPSAFTQVISKYLLSITEMIKSNQLPDKCMDPFVMDIIVKAVLKYMEDSNNIDKYEKFKRFESGDISGMTDEEINEFIDVKNHELKLEKLEHSIHNKLNNIISNLFDKYKITGKYLKPRLEADLSELFYKYRHAAIIDRNYYEQDYATELYELINEVYGESITNKLFISDFEYETNNIITTEIPHN